MECALVGYAEAAAEGGLAIAEDIPGESDARSEVVVVASSQSGRWSEATRSTDARKLS